MKFNQLVVVSIFYLSLIIIGTGCGGGSCNITDLTVDVGECTCIDGYAITLDFNVTDHDGEFFELFVRNNVSIGYYKVSDLPITIDHFTMSGLNDDYIKVAIVENPDCTAEIEFFPADCSEACDITDLIVDTGECNPDGTYALHINFNTLNPTAEKFDLYIRNDELLGSYSLGELPYEIEDFMPSGNVYDFIKICIHDNPNCCEVIEFMPPECEGECNIYDVEVGIGECNDDGSYLLELNFLYDNPGNEFYDLYVRNDELLGFYRLDELHLVLENFEPSGFDYDFLKICINDNPDCCYEIEFMPPDCEEECNISHIEVGVGECTSEETYLVEINFLYGNPGNEFFDLYVRNDELLGTYELGELPLILEDFPISGNQEDFIKVCINDNPDCCIVTEFVPPNCDEECEISELQVIPAFCTSDSTYTLSLDFIVTNPGNDYFEVFTRDNVLYDYYLLSELPLTIEHFPLSGFDYDFIKVCINDVEDCCKEIEFMPPEC